MRVQLLDKDNVPSLKTIAIGIMAAAIGLSSLALLTLTPNILDFYESGGHDVKTIYWLVVYPKWFFILVAIGILSLVVYFACLQYLRPNVRLIALGIFVPIIGFHFFNVWVASLFEAQHQHIETVTTSEAVYDLASNRIWAGTGDCFSCNPPEAIPIYNYKLSLFKCDKVGFLCTKIYEAPNFDAQVQSASLVWLATTNVLEIHKDDEIIYRYKVSP
jgi:hypothetical protein